MYLRDTRDQLRSD